MSAIEDIVRLLEYALAQKTLTPPLQAAMDRLRQLAKNESDKKP